MVFCIQENTDLIYEHCCTTVWGVTKWPTYIIQVLVSPSQLDKNVFFQAMKFVYQMYCYTVTNVLSMIIYYCMPNIWNSCYLGSPSCS